MLQFIVFGWPTKTKEYGATYPTECPHCNNENYFQLLKSRKWLSLYFIPILPLGSAQYDLVCPTCNASIKLNGRAEITQAKDLNTAATAYNNRELADAEFKRQVAAFEADVFEGHQGPANVDSQSYGGASGSIVRGLFAAVFGFALLTSAFGIADLNPAALGYTLFMLPYLAIRYQDPDSTTIPFAGFVKSRI